MKERPILFSTEMVRAILDGRKTQTRRIMKCQPERIPEKSEMGQPGFWIPFNAAQTMVRNEEMAWACPYGGKGDHLWVRETFCFKYDWNTDAPAKPEAFYYRADDEPHDTTHIKWVPSIHMPRRASRITLEITNVKVERLNDISEDDAIEEGIYSWHDSGEELYKHYGKGHGVISPKKSFETLWESINGSGSWEKNPWVWVIEFRRGK